MQFCGTLSWICTYVQTAKIIYIILKDLLYGTLKNQSLMWEPHFYYTLANQEQQQTLRCMTEVLGKK